MSSDYYASIAGEIADRGAQDEAAFLEWLNEYTRHEATGTYHDDLRAAFQAASPLATMKEIENVPAQAAGR